MAYYQQTIFLPEQVLSQAKDLIQLDKRQDALNSMYEFFLRRAKREWSMPLEDLMKQCIELCLDFEDHQSMKDLLSSYRLSTQNSNIQSLENIISFYRDHVKSGFDKALDSLKTSKKKEIISELIENDFPENHLSLSFCLKETSVKENVRKHWRYLMEAYKNILDLTFRNKKLENLYKDMCIEALKLCKEFSKNDVLQICSKVRSHQEKNIKNVSGGYNMIDITHTETNDLWITLHFEELEIVKYFQQWQEAFQILVSISELFEIRKEKKKMIHSVSYFENLATVFLQGGFYYYHALSYFQYFNMHTTHSIDISKEEVRQKASFLALSVLCIPKNSIEDNLSPENAEKLIKMISPNNTPPSKKEILDVLKNGHKLQQAEKNIQRLYQLLGNEFDILNFADDAHNICLELAQVTEYSIFIPLLEKSIISKLIENLSVVYSTITFEQFKVYLGKFSFKICEDLILHLSQQKKVYINYEKEIMIFGDDFDNFETLVQSLSILDQHIYELWAELRYLAEDALLAKANELQEKAKIYVENREVIIEERKKLMADFDKVTAKEYDKVIKEQDEELKKREEERKKELEKKEKIERSEKTKRDLDEKETDIKRKIVDSLRGKGVKIGNKKIETLTNEELHSITIDKLEEKKHETLLKEKEKIEKQLVSIFKKHQYEERARREAQIKILQDTIWKDSQINVEQIKTKHAEILAKNQEMKKPLEEAMPYKEKVLKEKLDQNRKEYEANLAEYQHKLDSEFHELIIKKAIEECEKEIARQKKENEAKAASSLGGNMNQSSGLRRAAAGEEQKQPQGPLSRGGAEQKPANTGFSRSTAEQKPSPAPITRGGLTRNEPKPEEPKTSGPRKFINTKKDTESSVTQGISNQNNQPKK